MAPTSWPPPRPSSSSSPPPPGRLDHRVLQTLGKAQASSHQAPPPPQAHRVVWRHRRVHPCPLRHVHHPNRTWPRTCHRHLHRTMGHHLDPRTCCPSQRHPLHLYEGRRRRHCLVLAPFLCRRDGGRGEE